MDLPTLKQLVLDALQAEAVVVGLGRLAVGILRV